MSNDPRSWQNASPADLSHIFPETRSTDPAAAIRRSSDAFPGWSRLTLEARKEALARCRSNIEKNSAPLAELIARETGKPIREARLELQAVTAKFDLTFSDADSLISEKPVTGGPHPAAVRCHPLGPAAVIAPFNFPIHLGHGATVAYLLAGNTVLFKPSPLASNTAAAYAREMQAALPPGVFEPVQGWGETSRSLCLDPAVRAVCFTGSIPVGRSLAKDLATDTSKVLALELGGKNSLVVCADADLDLAAECAADGMCLTAGQRCNATSRILVEKSIAAPFLKKLLASTARYQPGDPLEDSTLLGPLIGLAAHERYERLSSLDCGEWILPGGILEKNPRGQHGWYVLPAIALIHDPAALDASPLAREETFAPILVVETFGSDAEAIARHESWDFGLTASVFTRSDSRFESFAAALSVGNLYRNLPTTFSPSTLPFGGWGASGNSRPGARGFIRHAVREQAVQWRSAP
ncbi:MAG: aldehyde dehydrogenase family protein [Verrucomicrobia bacterium]|nr:aldehyde dehydrogenase family protein [Verrucomicrobiota bacterium]